MSPTPYWSSIDDEDAAQEVAHEALGAEAQGDAGDAGAGQQRTEADVELAQDQEDGDDVNGDRHDAAQHRSQRPCPLARAFAALRPSFKAERRELQHLAADSRRRLLELT
jgi:hypothetical protein